jgi:predicted DNA-binding transcriptional regulator AlpA
MMLDDPLLTARQSADEANVSIAAWWKAVSTGRVPAPVYPLPRAPRWRRSEVRAAIEATRMLSRDAKLAPGSSKLGGQRRTVAAAARTKTQEKATHTALDTQK